MPPRAYALQSNTLAPPWDLRCLQSPIANRNDCQSQNLDRKGKWCFVTKAVAIADSNRSARDRY
eukprot:2519208-Lingulodinium_polyedra.AAC.1